MNVTVYSTSSCAFCKVEKQWLDSKGVKYNSVNIEEDQDGARYLEERNITGVPVTVIEKDGDEEIVRGFNRPQLEKALAI